MEDTVGLGWDGWKIALLWRERNSKVGPGRSSWLWMASESLVSNCGVVHTLLAPLLADLAPRLQKHISRPLSLEK